MHVNIRGGEHTEQGMYTTSRFEHLDGVDALPPPLPRTTYSPDAPCTIVIFSVMFMFASICFARCAGVRPLAATRPAANTTAKHAVRISPCDDKTRTGATKRTIPHL